VEKRLLQQHIVPQPCMPGKCLQNRAITFHVELSADEVLDIPHEGAHLGAVVGVVGQLAPDEFLLSGGLIQQHQVHCLIAFWLDSCAHL